MPRTLVAPLSLAAALLLPRPAAAEANGTAPSTPVAVYDQVMAEVGRSYYDQSFGKSWTDSVKAHRDEAAKTKDDASFKAVVENVFADLGPWRPRFLSAEDQEYWAVRSAFAGDPALVPWRWSGIWFERRGARVFIENVFAGTPAAHAGLGRGDEVLAVNDAPLKPVLSFQTARPAAKLDLKIKRLAFDKPRTIRVGTEVRSVSQVLATAMRETTKVFDFQRKKIGYVQLPAAGQAVFREELTKAFSTFANDADGAILDLRGSFGGADLTLADLFFDLPENPGEKDPAKIKMKRALYAKPLVALVDRRTESGKEWLAWLFKQQKRAELVGEKTSGRYLAYTPFEIVPGRYLLFMPASGAKVRPASESPEGGVEPDVAVDWPLLYAGGADPVLNEALKIALQKVKGG